MYASGRRAAPWGDVFHWVAGVAGAVLFVSWAGFVTAEFFRPDFKPAVASYFQAAALAVVFCGYAVGWQRPVLGGGMSLVGMVLFIIVGFAGASAVQVMSAAPMILFAVPGLLYLLSAFAEHLRLARPRRA